MEINIGDLVLENEIELGAVELDIKTEVPDIEDLTVIPTKQEQVFTHPNSYGYDTVTVDAISSEYVIPTGTIDITENGVVNVKNYENANVNISSSYNVYADTTKTYSSENGLSSLTTSVGNLNTTGMTNFQGFFKIFRNLKNITVFDTSSGINMYQMFYDCESLESVPQINTQNATNMKEMFNFCVQLKNVPVLNTTNVTNVQKMFGSCSSLTNESLNNIMQMCINATNVSSNKTLQYIGLTSRQANLCKSLSNYNDFLAAGWTTGY